MPHLCRRIVMAVSRQCCPLSRSAEGRGGAGVPVRGTHPVPVSVSQLSLFTSLRLRSEGPLLIRRWRAFRALAPTDAPLLNVGVNAANSPAPRRTRRPHPARGQRQVETNAHTDPGVRPPTPPTSCPLGRGCARGTPLRSGRLPRVEREWSIVCARPRVCTARGKATRHESRDPSP